ncbi:MAG TPA: hypothetical protein VK558_02405 [Patescibacteria group bacterium]|nr:hypothetical protein [Patescibacteria group bacterium]
MSGSSKRTLPQTVTFRVTPEQADILEEVARPLSPGQFARRLALAYAGAEGPKPGRRPPPKVADADLLRDVLAEMGHWGGNLNQLAHNLNMGLPLGDGPVEVLRHDLEPIKRRLLVALGVLDA